MILLPYGESAVLVETGEVAPAQLRDLVAGRDGIGAVVPGARTLLIEYDASIWTTEGLAAALRQRREQRQLDAVDHVTIPVRYDGADLADLAELCGIDVDEVIRLHTATIFTVAFCGFSPGFAYLSGLSRELQVPRLAEPRTSVPAGSVAIAGEYSAVYPNTSPGGWRLLGTADATMWDATREPPALLAPGTTVRFVAT